MHRVPLRPSLRGDHLSEVYTGHAGCNPSMHNIMLRSPRRTVTDSHCHCLPAQRLTRLCHGIDQLHLSFQGSQGSCRALASRQRAVHKLVPLQDSHPTECQVPPMGSPSQRLCLELPGIASEESIARSHSKANQPWHCPPNAGILPLALILHALLAECGIRQHKWRWAPHCLYE